MYCLRGYKYNYFTRAICTKPTGLHCIFPCLAFIGRNPGGRLPLKWASYTAKQQEIQLNRQCQAFVVYSGSQKQEMVRNGFNPERIHVHVPVQCRGSGPVSSFSERNLILFVGQIIRGKGVDLLVRSLAKLQTPFEAVILGDGNHRGHCERLSRRLGLAGKVRFAGFVPSDQLRNYFLEATCLVVSSVWPEPFGLVGPEAMLHGLPVVAFDSGGIREWLLDGENGFLVPWMDTNRLSARIEQLLLDKSLARRLGRRGMELVNQVYDADLQIDLLEQVLLREGRSGPYREAQLKSDPPMNPAPVTL
jgi:glycosyltransferase involved in cell wall biosynthesis